MAPVFGLVFSFCFFASAQDAKPDEKKAMEIYMKLMALNENHDYLKNFVGKWDMRSTMWIGNTSTAFYLRRGTRDASGKVMIESGDWPDPMRGGMVKVRATTKFTSHDEFVSEMFMTGHDGKEFKTLENRAKQK